jgi:photosystem II stability/assembly factor-like uncharacterized protein
VAAALAIPSSASAGVALSTSDWQWSDPSPQGYTLNDIQFAGARGYAVGAGGTALRTDDGGKTWAGLFTGTGTTINSLDVVDANTIVVAVGNDGNCSLRESKDGGATFTLIQVADDDSNCSDSSFSSYDFVNPDVGFVLRSGGTVQKTANAGASFSAGSTVDGGTALRFVDATTGYAVGKGTVYKTTDAAQTWKPIYAGGTPLTQIRVIDADHIIAWGKDRLVRSVDAGATWTDGTIVGEPTRVSWSDANHLAFVADAKLILSDDGGVSVRQVTLGNQNVKAAAFVSPTRVVAVGLGGVTYESDDSAANFTRQSTDPVGASLRTITESAGGPVGLGTGLIGRVVNGQWVLRSTVNSSQVASADFSSADHGYVLFSTGVLQKTADNGVSWSRVEPGTPSAVQVVLTPSDDTALLFGGFGIYRATGGGTFDKVTGKLTDKFKPAFARDLGQRVVTWASSKKVGPIISSNGGQTWKAIKLPKGVTRVDDLRLLPGNGLLLQSVGRLFRSSNDKGKWTEITSLGVNVGVSSPGVRAASATEYFAGDDRDWGSSPVVYHSVDAGKTWQPQVVGADGTSISSLVASGPKSAFALSGSSTPFTTAIFSTTTGGSRGTPTTISLSKTPKKIKVTGGKIQISGSLSGAKGTETVHVGLRKVGAGSWSTLNVPVGVNGGLFTAKFKAKKGSKYVLVAQWAGDSGRAGYGTKAQALATSK